MKHTKKALAMLLALVMLLALQSVTAFAADTGKITIENAQVGKEYKLYKVFDATYSGTNTTTGEPTGVAYTIQSSDGWYALVSAADSPFALAKVLDTTTYNVTLKAGNDAAAVANWFKAKTEADGGAPVATATKNATSGTVEFTGLADGYYFISSGAGTTVTLTHATGSERQVIDKTLAPGWGDDATSGKFVKVGDGWAKNNTANAGDTLEYKIAVNSAVNYAGTEKITQYVIKDVQAAAIEADFNTMVVKVNGTALANGWDATGTGSAIGTSTATSKETADWYVEKDATGAFLIRINWQKADGAFKYENGGNPNTIEVTYSATLKNVTGLAYNEPGNVNTATLGYHAGSTDTFAPTESTVRTTTFSMLLHKVSSGDPAKDLAGAKFNVYKGNSTTALQFYPDKDYVGVYYLANEVNKNSDRVATGTTATNTVVTPANGRIIIRGLAGDTYQLEETEAPAGYNRITARITDTTELNDTNATTELTFAGTPDLALEKLCLTKVENSSGTVLPETGGIGTTLLITLGALAVIGTGLLLVTNKRISKENI